MGRGEDRTEQTPRKGYWGISCLDFLEYSDGTHVRGNGNQVREELQKIERHGQLYIWAHCLKTGAKNFTLLPRQCSHRKKSVPKILSPSSHFAAAKLPFLLLLGFSSSWSRFERREGETEQAENAFYPASPRFAYSRKALYLRPHLCLPCFTSPQGNARFTKNHRRKNHARLIAPPPPNCKKKLFSVIIQKILGK